jgi:DNA-binding NtrC family response regulator
MAKSIVKALVVDDQKTMLMMVEQMLRRAGYMVTTAEGGGEALVLLERDCFDIVITDLMMPEMNGLEFFRELHGRYPYLPVVMMTTEGAPDSAVEFIQAGGADFITKPIDDKKLVQKIERAIVLSGAEELGALQEVLRLIKEACISTERQIALVLSALSKDALGEEDRRAAVVAAKRVDEVLKSIPVMIMSNESMKGITGQQD